MEEDGEESREKCDLESGKEKTRKETEENSSEESLEQGMKPIEKSTNEEHSSPLEKEEAKVAEVVPSQDSEASEKSEKDQPILSDPKEGHSKNSEVAHKSEIPPVEQISENGTYELQTEENQTTPKETSGETPLESSSPEISNISVESTILVEGETAEGDGEETSDSARPASLYSVESEGAEEDEEEEEVQVAPQEPERFSKGSADGEELSEQEKLARRRSAIVKELLSTELFYVQHLEALVKSYMGPLRGESSHLLGPGKFKTIFSDIEVILQVNSLFLSHLQAQVSEWDPFTSKLGGVILMIADYLKVYTAYVNNYNEAHFCLKDCLENKEFALFCQNVRGNTEDHYGLEDYLIMPVQRIPRYEMLLLDLVKHTPADHPDAEELQKARLKIGEIAGFVNEQKRKVENITKVSDIIASIRGLENKGALLNPTRRFVKEGQVSEIMRVNPGDRGSEEWTKQKVYLFLFNDLLIWTSHKKKKHLYQKMHYIDSLKIQNGAHDGKMGIQLSWEAEGEGEDTSVTVILQSSSEDETAEWFDAILTAHAEAAQRENFTKVDKRKTFLHEELRQVVPKKKGPEAGQKLKTGLSLLTLRKKEKDERKSNEEEKSEKENPRESVKENHRESVKEKTKEKGKQEKEKAKEKDRGSLAQGPEEEKKKKQIIFNFTLRNKGKRGSHEESSPVLPPLPTSPPTAPQGMRVLQEDLLHSNVLRKRSATTGVGTQPPSGNSPTISTSPSPGNGNKNNSSPGTSGSPGNSGNPLNKGPLRPLTPRIPISIPIPKLKDKKEEKNLPISEPLCVSSPTLLRSSSVSSLPTSEMHKPPSKPLPPPPSVRPTSDYSSSPAKPTRPPRRSNGDSFLGTTSPTTPEGSPSRPHSSYTTESAGPLTPPSSRPPQRDLPLPPQKDPPLPPQKISQKVPQKVVRGKLPVPPTKKTSSPSPSSPLSPSLTPSPASPSEKAPPPPPQSSKPQRQLSGTTVSPNSPNASNSSSVSPNTSTVASNTSSVPLNSSTVSSPSSAETRRRSNTLR